MANKWVFAFSVLGVAVLHFIGTFMLAFIAGTTGGAFIKFLANALTFPLSMMQGTDDGGATGWIAWICLSLLWGFSFCFIVRLIFGGMK